MPQTSSTKQARWFSEGALVDVPDMSRAENRQRVIGWTLEPGDLVAFRMLTLHAAPGSAPLRRVFSARGELHRKLRVFGTNTGTHADEAPANPNGVSTSAKLTEITATNRFDRAVLLRRLSHACCTVILWHLNS